LLGHRITQVSGSSVYFERGVIAYSNDAKIQLLNVDPELIRAHGAVSSEVAAAMADGIRNGSNADFGISITGVAGPEGGSAEKPVGTVFVGLSQPEETITEKYSFPGSRERVKFASSQAALNLLRLRLLAGS
jgi:nicotinamide-nucleotide amidase